MAKKNPENQTVKEPTKTISVNVPLSVWKQAKIKCIEADTDLTGYVSGLIVKDCHPIPMKAE